MPTSQIGSITGRRSRGYMVRALTLFTFRDNRVFRLVVSPDNPVLQSRLSIPGISVEATGGASQSAPDSSAGTGPGGFERMNGRSPGVAAGKPRGCNGWCPRCSCRQRPCADGRWKAGVQGHRHSPGHGGADTGIRKGPRKTWEEKAPPKANILQVIKKWPPAGAISFGGQDKEPRTMKVKIMSRTGTKIVDLNRRKAIRERCLNCSCWIPKEVTHCEFKDCPLFPYRTGLGMQNAKDRKKAIRRYCLWCMNGKGSEAAKCVSPDCPLFGYRLGRVDRSVEIDSEAESAHIGPVSDTNGREPRPLVTLGVECLKMCSRQANGDLKENVTESHFPRAQ